MIPLKSQNLLRHVMVAAGMLLIALPGFSKPGKPNFGAAIYADGQVWGTKGNGALPPPNEHNLGSYDGLYMIPTQGMAVAEAAPGNPMYNGGRWITYPLEWTADGETEYGTDFPVLTSYAQILEEILAGHLTYADGDSDYFLCPLLPAKDA